MHRGKPYLVLISDLLKTLRKSSVNTGEWFFVRLILVKESKHREICNIVNVAKQFENTIP